MGPLRRGLITAAALLPGPAWAEACATVRPGWDGVPVTAWGETLALFSTPAALFLLAASVTAIALRSAIGALVVCLMWSTLTTIIVATDPTGLRDQARIEGCTASPALFIAAIAILCAAMVLYTARKT